MFMYIYIVYIGFLHMYICTRVSETITHPQTPLGPHPLSILKQAYVCILIVYVVTMFMFIYIVYIVILHM